MTFSAPALIPARTGIGWRAQHHRDLLNTLPAIGWLEVHSENYFGGGMPLHFLEKAREHYPISLHGVGLSLGSADGIDTHHLAQLKQLIDRIDPGLVSEHLSWSRGGSITAPDLLPLPYTEEALDVITANIRRTQDVLGRQILIENPSSYLTFRESTIPEWEFLAAVAERSDCGILLDLNNIYVSAHNHGFDAETYLRAIPQARVQEMHLAGFQENRLENRSLYIDTHSRAVHEDVWALYAQAIQHFGAKPTLIEWDKDIPALAVLLDEAHKADHILQEITHAHAA
ncbi:MAG: DUF692 domain-containing protein [Alphaproteobacteria bacterium]|nr:DUF692 domain-containing protein [Alphaproteobacteria bacterium]